ncbi:MAG TPA: DNA repair protein RecN [Tepidiformaceae bacterium]|nr:DNA repair protein RecN [Tepidiformaceae bacterium]
MLERLSVRDFAVARSVEIEPGAGLTVFTGETGAGKSLIVDALAFVFGARRGREVVASGAERATVVAKLAGGAEIERSIGSSGRSSARIDGLPASLDQLQAAGAGAIDIHGQSEQLGILKPAVQVRVLDRYAGLSGDQEAVATLAAALRDVRRRLRALRTDAHGRERMQEQLTFETNEIREAALTPGEDDALRQEQSRLGGAGRILEDVAAAEAALEAAPTGEIAAAVNDIAARDSGAAHLADLAAVLETSAGDLARALRRYRDTVEEDPERLAAVGARLDLIARLRRKYGETIPDILAYLDDAQARLAALSNTTESADVLEAREGDLARDLGQAAERLSHARRAAAGRLVAALAAELDQLGMSGAALFVGFGCDDDDAAGVPVSLPDYDVIGPGQEPSPSGGEAFTRAFTDSGVDRVEFLVSFNRGESPRPLGAVASGGETSRFLLALTAVLGSAAEPRTIVFDEVDEGVGGRAGALVGAALARLARRHRVLCITHLPQVAAFGDAHFVVEKHTDGARTWSEVRPLTPAERVDELAAMLGGVSEATRDAARELLAAARA